MEFLNSVLTITIRAGTSLMFATIGEILTERSGILNLGVEGTMLMGALSAFVTVFYTHSLALGFLVAIGIGGLLALLHAFLTTTMRANQVVSGLSITLFGTGFSSFLGQRLGPATNNFRLVGLRAERIAPLTPEWAENIPILGAFLNQDILTYIVYLLIPVAWFFLYKTRQGLWLRAVGENPQTADAMGINVIKTRYLYTIIGAC